MNESGTRWTLHDLESAIDWCSARNTEGIRCIIDVLGEYAREESQSVTSVRAYLTTAKAIDKHGLSASLTVKLSALGALFDKELCCENVQVIARAAARRHVGFEVDMEGQNLVTFTMDVARSCVEEGQEVTLALQAYLDRTPDDLKRVLDEGVTPRIVKGAYQGTIADFDGIQQRFKELVELLYARDVFFTVGTHDPDLIKWARKKMEGRRDLIEFGFLKGLADKTKIAMANDEWLISEYVPFGQNQAAYVARRRKYLRGLQELRRIPVP